MEIRPSGHVISAIEGVLQNTFNKKLKNFEMCNKKC